jgi:hypothetical protein
MFRKNNNIIKIAIAIILLNNPLIFELGTFPNKIVETSIFKNIKTKNKKNINILVLQ